MDDAIDYWLAFLCLRSEYLRKGYELLFIRLSAKKHSDSMATKTEKQQSEQGKTTTSIHDKVFLRAFKTKKPFFPLMNWWKETPLIA